MMLLKFLPEVIELDLESAIEKMALIYIFQGLNYSADSLMLKQMTDVLALKSSKLTLEYEKQDALLAGLCCLNNLLNDFGFEQKWFAMAGKGKVIEIIIEDKHNILGREKSRIKSHFKTNLLTKKNTNPEPGWG